jgi:hypothetical protein
MSKRKVVLESVFLRELSGLSNLSIEFKDERVLPGTCYIDGMPMDIEIAGTKLLLNSVGEFSGDSNRFSKSENRGKGKFRRLVPYLKVLLAKYKLEPRVYLTPLSPVWSTHYVLKEATAPFEKGYGWYVDLDLFQV